MPLSSGVINKCGALFLFVFTVISIPCAQAVNSVIEPSSSSQPSLGRATSSGARGEQQSDRGEPEAKKDKPAGSNQSILSKPVELPDSMRRRPPVFDEVIDAMRWPQNVFKVGRIDMDMVAPGEINALPPDIADLVPLGRFTNPLRLEASADEALSLRQTLVYILKHNLAIHISQEDVAAAKWKYVRSLGRFLPDLESEYQNQAQQGALSINGALFISLHNPFIFTRTGLRQSIYRGGSVVFGAMRQKHLLKAAVSEDHATVHDALLEGAKRYYAAVLEDVLLQIRVKSVQASTALLTQNDWLKNRGILTKLEVLQSEAQVARDKQLLIHEQIARRNAAIRLASYLNEPSFANYTFATSSLKKTRLISDNLDINALLHIASMHRPELQMAQEKRLAAKNAIVIASASLQPNVSVFANIIGSGATLAPSYTNVPPGFDAVALAGTPVPANVAGHISLPLPPVVLGTPEPGPGQYNVLPAGFVPTPAQQISRRIRGLFTAGFNVQWTLGGLGVMDAAEINAARAEARKEALKELDDRIKVMEEVRTSYLNSIDAESRIDQTTSEVAAAAEELRFAQERLSCGVGTSVDVINAQKDYTSSLVNKANAIIDFNVAQLQILHDIGLIDIEHICSGRLLDKIPARSHKS